MEDNFQPSVDAHNDIYFSFSKMPSKACIDAEQVGQK
jgi:hypothetical protein